MCRARLAELAQEGPLTIWFLVIGPCWIMWVPFSIEIVMEGSHSPEMPTMNMAKHAAKILVANRVLASPA